MNSLPQCPKCGFWHTGGAEKCPVTLWEEEQRQELREWLISPDPNRQDLAQRILRMLDEEASK